MPTITETTTANAQEAPATELDPSLPAASEQTASAPPPDASDPDPAASDDPLPEAEDPRVKKANAEAARYRKQLRDAEERLAKLEEQEKARTMTVEERLKAAEERAEKAEASALERILRAERLAALAGKVSHPDRVLKLMDDPDAYFDGSTPKIDKIVGDFAEYAPPKSSTPASVPGAGGSAPRQAPLDDASAALARGDIRAYAAAIAAKQARANLKE